MKRYSGIQPQYFPRLHYFARIMNTDIFMIRDDAQFVRRHKYPDGKNGPSYQGHSPIKSPVGIYLLTLSLKHEGLTPIYRTQINYQENWVNSHVKTIETAYRKALNFDLIFPEIKTILKKEHGSLMDLNLSTILWGVLRLLGEKKVNGDKLTLDYVNKKLAKDHQFRLKQIQLATSLKAHKNFKNMLANEKIIAIFKEVGAKEDYCGGTAIAAYVDHDLFKKHEIKITVQDWKCQTYPQLFKDKHEFIPNLSIIDLLMNVQHKEAVRIING